MIDCKDYRLITSFKSNFKASLFTKRVTPLVLHSFANRSACYDIIKDNKDTELLKFSNINVRNDRFKSLLELEYIDKYFTPNILLPYVNKAYNTSFKKLDYIVKDTADYNKKVTYSIATAGNFIKPHYDVIIREGKLIRPNRTLSALLYLNDCKDNCKNSYTGGEIYFQNITNTKGDCFEHAPMAGDVIIFPSNYNYMHGVKTVIKGTRHAVILFMSVDDIVHSL